MTLSPGQLAALANLARKQAGEEVDWISIADARTLTELGLAERSREGWKITPLGLEHHRTSTRAEPAQDVPPTAPHALFPEVVSKTQDL